MRYNIYTGTFFKVLTMVLLVGMVLFFYSTGSMIAGAILGPEAKNERFWSGVAGAGLLLFLLHMKVKRDTPKL